MTAELTKAAEMALKALELVREFNPMPPCDEGFVDDAIRNLKVALTPSLTAERFVLSDEDLEALTHQRALLNQGAR